MAIALFPFRKPIAEATGYFGGIAIHIWSYGQASDDLQESDTLSAAPGHGKSPPKISGPAKQIFPSLFGDKHNMVFAIPFGMR